MYGILGLLYVIVAVVIYLTGGTRMQIFVFYDPTAGQWVATMIALHGIVGFVNIFFAFCYSVEWCGMAKDIFDVCTYIVLLSISIWGLSCVDLQFGPYKIMENIT